MSAEFDIDHQTIHVTALITALFETQLSRKPKPNELAIWTTRVQNLSPHAIVRLFADTNIEGGHQDVPTFFAPGHFHSPIVDPSKVGQYVHQQRSLRPSDVLCGMNVDVEAMRNSFVRAVPQLNALSLSAKRVGHQRYYSEGSPFPAGDAASLYLMMAAHQPARIVEVGAGFSTAAMLDFAEKLQLEPFSIRCIEPDPRRLKALIKPGDEDRVELIEARVQDVALSDVIGDLRASDFLFIDSTHVLKTGSDVHHQLFTVYPAVPLGVLIHVHDCPYPFEYPDLWIFERNYLWNEVYALRAFLMYNFSFEILFWAGLLNADDATELKSSSWHHSDNVGTSLWLRRIN